MTSTWKNYVQKWNSKKQLIVIALLLYNIKYTYTLHIKENNLMEKYAPNINDVCDVARHSKMRI